MNNDMLGNEDVFGGLIPQSRRSKSFIETRAKRFIQAKRRATPRSVLIKIAERDILKRLKARGELSPAVLRRLKKVERKGKKRKKKRVITISANGQRIRIVTKEKKKKADPGTLRLTPDERD